MDGEVCTNDSCDPQTGVHVANTLSCDDSNACTTPDTCANKVCVAGAIKSCDDGIVCTSDSCDPQTGCVNVANTSFCEDGDSCTTPDTCANKVCVAGAIKSCDDGNVCTTDTCTAATGDCSSTLNAGYCQIAGDCYQAGETKSGDDCLVCDPSQRTDDWTVDPCFIVAIAPGAEEKTVGDYKILSFKNPGQYTFTITKGRGTIEIFIVGGGGSGGALNGGGGGAGATKWIPPDPLTLYEAGAYPVLVGVGGQGVSPQSVGINGGPSSFAGYIAVGGGGGGGCDAGNGQNGASGGGGGACGAPGIATPDVNGLANGSNGGYGSTATINVGGGGGGAGGPGDSGSATQGVAGAGGDGITNTITGLPIFYASGGGGGCDLAGAFIGTPGGAKAGGGGAGGGPGHANGYAGTNGLGGGGGGAGYGPANGTSGAGGSGGVYLKYKFR